jgi:dolichol-phosphate mannosyltransferase
MKRVILAVIAALQLALGARMLVTLARTAGGTRVRASTRPVPPSVGILVPVLNEAGRLAPCLEGIISSGPEVAEIVVIDGGSTDDTVAIVRRFQERDARIRLVETVPPDGTNGKAHGLEAGRQLLATEWVLTIDADVRPEQHLAASLVAHAEAERVNILSVATRQWLGDRLDHLVHPSMLASLVYRLGIPGRATDDPRLIQANGQCMLIRTSLLNRLGGFKPYAHTIAEDIGLAQAAARSGERVGFYETDDLVSVAMYAHGVETALNWSRSLSLRESRSRNAQILDLAGILLLQAAPPALYVLSRERSSVAQAINAGLISLRLGLLAGTRRAYRNPGPLYWLSPAADVPVWLLLALRSVQRSFTWRGRRVHQGEP